MNVIGDVEGRTCILQDDIIDTAGTITKAAPGAARRTAPSGSSPARCTACCRAPAIERIEKSPIDRLIVTNTIPLSTASARACSKIVRAVGGAAARAGDQSIHEETSVSSLFV